jgi:hypothetical protein
MNTVEQFLALAQMRNNLVVDINKLLKKFKVSGCITIEDLVITDSSVTDTSQEKLSEFIISSIWPSVSSATVYHYTRKASAESILKTDIFRLTNIEKRYNEGEIVAFCKTHKLNGYLDQDSDGNPAYRKLLMPNTFYASFTDAELTSEEEEYFWRSFAGAEGARLKIKIEATNTNLRHIYYEGKSRPLPLFEAIRQCVKKHTGLEYTLRGISRLCAFYLRDYSHEKELRALHKTYEGWGMQPQGVAADSYIEIPLGVENECGYKMTVLEVQASEQLDIPSHYEFSKRTI